MAKRRRPAVAPWGNRIVRVGTARAGDLQANERNWRTHGARQGAALDGVLTAVGFVQGVIVNLRRSSRWGRDKGVETVVDGHERVRLALGRDEDTELPVVYVDLEPEEERLVLATFDPIGGMAGRDDDVLAPLVEEIRSDFADEAVDLEAILQTERRKVSFEAGTATNVLVFCDSADTQNDVMERLTAMGMTCKATSRR